jgi:hypothetical protein
MEPITFKFRFVNASGQETGFLASKGKLDEEALVLDKTVLPLGCIYQVVHRYNRLAVVYASDNGPATLTIVPGGGLDRTLKQSIDRLCSYRWAENRQQQLIQEGHGAAFRTAKCRLCTAVVDLTGFRETAQFYCPFCEKILSSDYQMELNMDHYRRCDRCGYYSFPTRFTAVYIILNVVSWREHHSCHVCMRRECWKMLLGNLLPPFVGTVFAIGHTIRAYAAGDWDARFPELVRANAFAHKGRVEQAEALYQAMLERLPAQAGLRYNLALAFARAGQWAPCLQAAQAALEDCSNYQAAANLVCQALQQLQRGDEATQFSQSWGRPGSDSAIPQQNSAASQHIQRRTASDRGDAIRE